MSAACLSCLIENLLASDSLNTTPIDDNADPSSPGRDRVRFGGPNGITPFPGRTNAAGAI